MKTIKTLLFLFALATIIFGWLYYDSKKSIDSCKHDLIICQTELTKCKDECNLCESGDQNLRILSNDYDFSLKIDFKKVNVYQPFQYDIANGYSILGSIVTDENSEKINGLDFELYEAGTCNRYKMEKITHEQRDNKHIFEVNIEPLNGSDNKPYSLKKPISFSDKDIVYVKIVSNNLPQLRTDFAPKIDGYTIQQTESIVRHFPPYICPAQIYDGTAL